MRNQPLTFDEFTPVIEDCASRRKVRLTLVGILEKVEKVRDDLDKLQASCDHPQEYVKYAPTRRLFQCQLCGCLRHHQFGV